MLAIYIFTQYLKFSLFPCKMNTANHWVKRCTSVSQGIFLMFLLTQLYSVAETVTTDIAAGSLILSAILFAYDEVLLSGRAVVGAASRLLLTGEDLVQS
jgi:hypothetical protein